MYVQLFLNSLIQDIPRLVYNGVSGNVAVFFFGRKRGNLEMHII